MQEDGGNEHRRDLLVGGQVHVEGEIARDGVVKRDEVRKLAGRGCEWNARGGKTGTQTHTHTCIHTLKETTVGTHKAHKKTELKKTSKKQADKNITHMRQARRKTETIRRQKTQGGTREDGSHKKKARRRRTRKTQEEKDTCGKTDTQQGRNTLSAGRRSSQGKETHTQGKKQRKKERDKGRKEEREKKNISLQGLPEGVLRERGCQNAGQHAKGDGVQRGEAPAGPKHGFLVLQAADQHVTHPLKERQHLRGASEKMIQETRREGRGER